MKEMLFDEYWLNFWIYLTISIAIIVGLIILFVFRDKLLLDKGNINDTRTIRVIVFITVSILTLFSLVRFTSLYMDLSYVNSDACELFVGEFVEHTRYVESNTPGYPRGKNPLFKDYDSGEDIILTGTKEYEVGQSYTIYYLPNSMIYVIEKTDNNN